MSDDETTAPPEGDPELASKMRAIRERIDALDAQIVGLLNERAQCALDIGRLKEDAGLETYQPGREVEVLEHVRRVSGGPLGGDAIRRLFERIIDENRRLERLDAEQSDS